MKLPRANMRMGCERMPAGFSFLFCACSGLLASAIRAAFAGSWQVRAFFARFLFPQALRGAVTLSSVILLCACSNTTDIQRRYVDMRDNCRTIAERWIERAQAQMQQQAMAPRSSQGQGTPAPVPAAAFEQKDVNAQLATVFSDCMFEKGWTVATPPKERRPGEAEAIEARQRADASRVSRSDGIGIGPSLEPGKNMPNFRKLKYR